MRLTTKIVLGIIGFIFILSLGLIIGFSFSDYKDDRKERLDFTLSQEPQMSIQVGSFKTILFENSSDYSDYSIHLNGELNLVPAGEEVGELGTICFPEELAKYIHAEVVNDTLRIRLDGEALSEQLRGEEQAPHWTFIQGINMTVNAHSADVISRFEAIVVRVSDLNTDLIKIKGDSDIYLENCTATKVVPRHQEHKRLTLLECRVDTLDMDLERMGTRDMLMNEIAVEIWRGSRHHEVRQSNLAAKEVLWIPKGSDAKLEMVFEADTARIVFP